MTRPTGSGDIGLGRNQDYNADEGDITYKECQYCNGNSLGSLDIQLKSGLCLESRQIKLLSL